jgi:hypothetical protein
MSALMDLRLSDQQTAALLAELDRIIDADRYPLSPRIRALKEIRALIKVRLENRIRRGENLFRSWKL